MNQLFPKTKKYLNVVPKLENVVPKLVPKLFRNQLPSKSQTRKLDLGSPVFDLCLGEPRVAPCGVVAVRAGQAPQAAQSPLGRAPWVRCMVRGQGAAAAAGQACKESIAA